MTDSIYNALCAAQAEFPGIPLNRVNPHYRSRYADLAGILSAVRPALNKHGLYLAFNASFGEGALEVTACVYNDAGERHCASVALPLSQNTPQGVGSVLTYGRRYAVAMLLGIAADDDDDGETSKSPVDARKPTATPLRTATATINAVAASTPATNETTPPPSASELDVIGAWRQPADAYAWAVSVGACRNEFEARNSFRKIVDDHGGKSTKANIGAIYVGFYRRQIAKMAAAARDAAPPAKRELAVETDGDVLFA
jgi:hypothetical protein